MLCLVSNRLCAHIPAITLVFLAALTARSYAQTSTTAEAFPQVNSADARRPDEKPLTEDEAKKMVEVAIANFYRGIVASDRATRTKAVRTLSPKEKHLACLFGKKHGKIGFEVIKPRIDRMLASVDEVSSQLSRDGRFLRCDLEVLQIPTKLERRALAALMQDMCPETFRFSAEIHTEKAQSSSSSFYVIDRKVVYIRDGELIKIAGRINTSR